MSVWVYLLLKELKKQMKFCSNARKCIIKKLEKINKEYTFT